MAHFFGFVRYVIVVAGLGVLMMPGGEASSFPLFEFPVPKTVLIPAGSFVMGSDDAEREAAYQIDEQAYGHAITREGRWYAGEFPRHNVTLPGYAISKTPVTNGQYAAFVKDTGYKVPRVDEKTWASYGLIHPFSRTVKFSWPDTTPPPGSPPGRAEHPVVLVNHADALAYAAWLSKTTGKVWRLPTEQEWEKAIRGGDGRWFPWGNTFDANRLNSHDGGPFDTTPVGTYPKSKGPFGVLDGSGEVYEWTNTPGPKGRFIVKGGSWDDKGCGVCRPAARHSRPENLKHILIGFRVVCETCLRDGL